MKKFFFNFVLLFSLHSHFFFHVVSFEKLNSQRKNCNIENSYVYFTLQKVGFCRFVCPLGNMQSTIVVVTLKYKGPYLWQTHAAIKHLYTLYTYIKRGRGQSRVYRFQPHSPYVILKVLCFFLYKC